MRGEKRAKTRERIIDNEIEEIEEKRTGEEPDLFWEGKIDLLRDRGD